MLMALNILMAYKWLSYPGHQLAMCPTRGLLWAFFGPSCYLPPTLLWSYFGPPLDVLRTYPCPRLSRPPGSLLLTQSGVLAITFCLGDSGS